MATEDAGPAIRHCAADLSTEALGSARIRTFGRHFVDGYGRVVRPRGFNVSGASKLPTRPNGLSHLADGFFDHENVSFVGRPFPLEEAHFHLARLRAWGHTLVRLLVTWEALSHSGPGDLDEEYIQYLDALLKLMDQYGICVILCAHQDVWSRFSGGSGAPGWTFEKAGLDIEGFKATGAAFVHNLFGEDESISAKQRGKRKEPVGAFVWPSGYQKLAAATMATLFWGGDIFAWQLKIPHFDAERRAKGETLGIQQYLQESYMEAFGALIDRLGQTDALLGIDVINEPHRGYVGLRDWHGWCYETDLHIGHFPSPLQGLALGSGYRQDVPFYVKSWPWPTRRTHKSTVDPLGKTAWLPDSGMKECVWRAHGAWQWDEKRKQPIVLVDDYFTRDPRPGKGKQRIEWYRDCYAPFIVRFLDRIRRKHKHFMCFFEPIPNEFMPPWSSPEMIERLSDKERMLLMKASYDQSYATKTFIDTLRPSNLVYAPHFYDLNVLFGKTFKTMSVDVQGLSRGQVLYKCLFFGTEGLLKNYTRQISTLVANGKASLGVVPTIVGEVGIPLDINEASALKTGDYGKHIELYDALIRAMEDSEVAFTLWNYNPDNTVAHGDGWNQEDFSVVCNERSALDIHNDVVDREAASQSQPRLRGKHDWTIEELHYGGRALTAILRPYAVKVAGYPLESSWDREKRIFEFHYANPPPGFREAALRGAGNVKLEIRSGGQKNGAPAPASSPKGAETDDVTRALASSEARTTYIFVPRYHFDGCRVRVQVKDGTYTYDREQQTLAVCHADDTPGQTHIVRISATQRLADEDLSPETRALVARREANARRRRGRIPLTPNDIFAIVSVILIFVVMMGFVLVAQHVMRTIADESQANGREFAPFKNVRALFRTRHAHKEL